MAICYRLMSGTMAGGSDEEGQRGRGGQGKEEKMSREADAVYDGRLRVQQQAADLQAHSGFDTKSFPRRKNSKRLGTINRLHGLESLGAHRIRRCPVNLSPTNGWPVAPSATAWASLSRLVVVTQHYRKGITGASTSASRMHASSTAQWRVWYY
ncbi:hypothetical protein EJ02DRAFT_39256 [Clathrospora elynae]|uniref:Uncharacterized protein n=1 Tax=Clathrospora elynae TaxID=706981 RepID=A0A6A5SD66_9PLEO|nr:hypothetical protein EJ02DRAFT_39256 [Clathrospora elynae]